MIPLLLNFLRAVEYSLYISVGERFPPEVVGTYRTADLDLVLGPKHKSSDCAIVPIGDFGCRLCVWWYFGEVDLSLDDLSLLVSFALNGLSGDRSLGLLPSVIGLVVG